MLIYDGHGDKLTPVTHRSAEVVSCGTGGNGDHMTLRKNGRGDFSLFFVEKGTMYFDDVPLTKNQVWIYPPKIKQEYVTYKNDNVKYYYLHFTGNRLDELISSLNIPLTTPLNADLSETLKIIKKETACDDALSKLKCEYLTLKLLSLLSETAPFYSKENMMKKVIDEMHHSYFLPFDGQRLAKTYSLSLSRFNHLFKEITGLPPQRYFNNIRMKNAGILLKETDLAVKEIAQKCGFSDPLYFGQAFKKFFGISPTEYRKK